MVASCAFLTTFAYTLIIDFIGIYIVGISGLAQFFSRCFETNFFFTYLLINTPIIFWGFFYVGFQFSFYTVLYLLFQNLFSNTIVQKELFWKDRGSNWNPLTKIVSLSDNELTIFGVTYRRINDGNWGNEFAVLIIFIVFAAFLFGVSLGLLFKVGGCSGGTDFFATYISLKRNYSIVNVVRFFNIVLSFVVTFLDNYFGMNNFVVHKTIQGFFFQTPLYLLTLFFIFLSGSFTNYIFPKFKFVTVFLITRENEKLRQHLYQNSNRKYIYGGNFWSVTGLYSKKDYFMVMTTMNLLEYSFFKGRINYLRKDEGCLIVLSTREFNFFKKIQ